MSVLLVRTSVLRPSPITASLPHSLKEFLPKEYIKHKGEKRIFQVRTNLLGSALLLKNQLMLLTKLLWWRS